LGFSEFARTEPGSQGLARAGSPGSSP
jgi:hypothetical protein